MAKNKQVMEKFPQGGRDPSKRYSPPTLPGKPGNKQTKMKQGVDPSNADPAKRWHPPAP